MSTARMLLAGRLPHDAWRALLAAAVLAVLWCQSARAETATERGYRLAPGDRINVLVMGQAELSGVLTIDDAGEIRLPLLGTLRVGGTTVEQTQAHIQEGLSRGYLKQPAVAVRIEEVRPIHILGDVTTPGSLKYQYGSIVKSAIAQAGGYASLARSMGVLPELLAAQERMFSLSARLDMLRVMAARLEQQLAGATSFTPPEVGTISKDQFDRLVAAEQRALQTLITDERDRNALLKSQRPQLVAEDAAINGQIAEEHEQIRILRQKLEAFTSLKARGLARSTEVVDVEVAVSVKQSNVWRLEAERARLRLAINDLDARIQLADKAFKEQTLSQISVVQQQLFETEAAIPPARDLLALRMQALKTDPDAAPSYSISITRTRNGAATTTAATEATRLEPGDIIEVRAIRQRGDATALARPKL